MNKIFLAALMALPLSLPVAAQDDDEIKEYKGYTLVWHDEFDVDGKPNPDNWDFEHGFVRNEENQWYQEDNAFCENGKLIIEGRKERFKNPEYGQHNDWRNREYVDYTSSCLTTNKKHSWTYGRFVIKAKIPAYTGCWPAIWTLGQDYDGIYSWPHCGEVDIMEFYQLDGTPHILANACWGSATSKYNPTWNAKSKPLSDFLAEDPDWGDKFHEWRMDWDENNMKLYLDNKLMNLIPLATTVNPQTSFFDVEGYNPFKHPQYLLVNLALGGKNGGSLSNTPFPCRYEIEYVRVYQKKSTTGIYSVYDESDDNVDVVVNGNTVSLVSSEANNKVNVAVVDMYGRIVWKGCVMTDIGQCVVPVNLAAGVYVVKLEGASGFSYSKKIQVA